MSIESSPQSAKESEPITIVVDDNMTSKSTPLVVLENPILYSLFASTSAITTSFSISLFETLIDEGDASATPLRNYSYLLNRDLLLDSITLLIFIARESYKSKNYEETIADNNSNSEEWEDVIENEIDFLMKNKTWELVDCLKDRKSLKNKWVFILKRGSKEEITRYKARWVILKCSQREELDYNEIFVLVMKFMSYKALFALAAILN